jgi:hypothetical protein
LASAGAAVASSTIVYFVLPVGPFGAIGTWAFVAVFAVGLMAVSALIARQVRHYRTDSTRLGSIAGLAASLYLAILFFAAVYYGLAEHMPGSITSLTTKIDALYFALAITTTVGFGDVHAMSQLARAVVAVHMVFNIGFLGLAVTALRGR